MVLYSLSEFLFITHGIVGKWKVFLVIYFSEILCCIYFGYVVLESEG